jgi:hypothetical protein
MRFKQHCHHRLPYRLWHLSVHRGYHCFDTNTVVKINRIILVQHKFPPPALSPQQFSTSLPPSPLYLPLPPATTTAALHCLPIPSNTLSPPASGHHHCRHLTPTSICLERILINPTRQLHILRHDGHSSCMDCT